MILLNQNQREEHVLKRRVKVRFGMLKIYMLIVVVGLVGGVVYAGYYYIKTHNQEFKLLQKIMQNLKQQKPYKTKRLKL